MFCFCSVTHLSQTHKQAATFSLLLCSWFSNFWFPYWSRAVRLQPNWVTQIQRLKRGEKFCHRGSRSESKSPQDPGFSSASTSVYTERSDPTSWASCLDRELAADSQWKTLFPTNPRQTLGKNTTKTKWTFPLLWPEAENPFSLLSAASLLRGVGRVSSELWWCRASGLTRWFYMKTILSVLCQQWREELMNCSEWSRRPADARVVIYGPDPNTTSAAPTDPSKDEYGKTAASHQSK